MECRKLQEYDYQSWKISKLKPKDKINKVTSDKTYFRIFNKRYYIITKKLNLYKKIFWSSIGVTEIFMLYSLFCYLAKQGY